MLGRHQPAWDALRGPLDYLARTMYVLQQGVAKMDVAFYQKRTSYARPATGYVPGDLRQAGYTYGYLDPATLASPDAVVQDGVLAPRRQAYRALIVRGSDSVTVPGAGMLAKLARAGLPLVFAGGLPSYVGGHHDRAGRAYVNQTLRALRCLANVHHVPREDGLADVVAALGIEPRTRVRARPSAARWWPVWHETADGRAQYALVYHEGEERSAGTVTFRSTGRPYRYAASSGAVTPVGVYTQQGTTTTIDLVLEPHQAVLVGFHHGEPPAVHATATSAGVLDVRFAAGGLRAVVGSSPAGAHAEWVRTSDGVVHRVPAVAAAPAALGNWTLVVEHWDPPSPLTDIAAVASRWNSTHRLDGLASWQQIPGLAHASGRGYYTTTFAWPPAGAADPVDGALLGALLSLGPVIHTMAASVNGHALDALDALAGGGGTADITPFLVAGAQNTLEVVVSTTLANRLAPIWDTLRTSGAPPTGLFGSETRPPGNADYGLVGPVTLIPYREVALAQQGLVQQAHAYAPPS